MPLHRGREVMADCKNAYMRCLLVEFPSELECNIFILLYFLIALWADRRISFVPTSHAEILMKGGA